MEITLHILNAFLAASRTLLNQHLMEKPSKSVEEEKDREELKVALIAAQESAAIQVLLEACLPRYPEEDSLVLKQVQNLICTNLHQVFISDPNLVKLVHFQTYSSDLLPLTVSSIPSMHIVLDFLPELLSQPDLEKQVFAIELCSFLSVKYPIAKSLCVAKLSFSVSNTLLSLLSGDKRSSFFIPVLPALVRLVQPFPPLKEDALVLVSQLRQVAVSKLASSSCCFVSPSRLEQVFSKVKERNHKSFLTSLTPDEALYFVVQDSWLVLQQQDNTK